MLQSMDREKVISAILEDEVRGIHPSHWPEISKRILTALDKEEKVQETTWPLPALDIPEVPLDKNAKIDLVDEAWSDEEKIEAYENHLRNRIDDIGAELSFMGDLPLWSKKERKQIEKAYEHLYKMVYPTSGDRY